MSVITKVKARGIIFSLTQGLMISPDDLENQLNINQMSSACGTNVTAVFVSFGDEWLVFLQVQDLGKATDEYSFMNTVGTHFIHS